MRSFWFLIVFFCATGSCLAQLRQNCSPYQQKIDEGKGDFTIFYRAASCYASNGLRDKAFTNLLLAAQSGYRNTQNLDQDPRFRAYHTDKRWQEVIAAIAAGKERYLNRVNRKLFELYKEYVSAQQNAGSAEQASERRQKVLTLANDLHVGEDYFHAGVILHHSMKKEQNNMAYEWLKKAYKMTPDLRNIKPLLCAAEDRLLLSMNKPQAWATQTIEKEGKWVLAPFDSKKTDDQRMVMGLPPLGDLSRKVYGPNPSR